MMKMNLRRAVVLALAVGGTACSDVLEVKNLNNPETARVLSKPADVEKLVGDSYLAAFRSIQSCCSVGIQQQAMAAEISPMAANFGMIERSIIPRQSPNNTTADQFASQYYSDYGQLYRAISNASDGVRQLNSGVNLGSATANNRARAWARFVQGLAHGYLALTYDSMLVVTEATDLGTVVPVAAATGMTAALGLLDSTIALATANTFTIPSTWANGATITNETLIRLARSYKAKFRANVARTPADVAGVNWTAVIADINAGITANFNITSDYNIWYFGPPEIHSFYGAWNQVHMFYMGMADTSGAYQTWMGTEPLTARTPFVVATPDLRWPRGTTNTTQQLTANRGTYFRNKGTSGHVRSDRGTWRWSFYTNNRYQAFYDARFIGAYPILLKSEMDLLLAEAYIRAGQTASALPIINSYRETAGLPAVTADGVPVDASCVPRLPNGNCASLLEALKYEKRIETMYQGTWYFDSRRWGDLPAGTPVDYPIPARELEVLGRPLYTRGGVGLPGGAATNTYGF